VANNLAGLRVNTDDPPFTKDEAMAFTLDLMEAAINDRLDLLDGIDDRAAELDPDGDGLIFAVTYMLLESICHYFDLRSHPDRMVGISTVGNVDASPEGQAMLTAVRLVASYANRSENTKFLLLAALDADDTGEAGARLVGALLQLFKLGHDEWKATQ
jgi:hypothetical protein